MMNERQQDEVGTGRLGARPGRVFGVVLGALLIAVLLNAPELKRDAERKPFGKERDTWVAIWKPFAAVSSALYLDKPREWFDEATGRDGDGGDVFELPTSPDGSPAATATQPARTATPGPTPTPTPPPQLVRTPTELDPLRIWVGGDSMSKILGEAVLRQADETLIFDAVQDSQLSSGLTRPDFFDWPGHFNALAKEAPGQDVFVVMFGANDSQGIQTPEGKIFQTDEAGWAIEYRRRVAGTMDVLRASNRMVVWVGQPIMRDAGFSERMERLNAIYREEAAKRPWVKYLDLWPLFATPEGTYDPYILDDDGELKLMRHPDGIHLVRDGGERAARAILALIRAEAKLP